MPVPADTSIDDPLAHLRSRAHEWLLPEILDSVANNDMDVFFGRDHEVRVPRFHRGRVALIGDAAHAFHPIVGMGASMALRDACTLADTLGNQRGDAASDVPTAFEHYTRRRRGKVRRTRLQAAAARATVLSTRPTVRFVRDRLARSTSLVTNLFDVEAKRHTESAR